MKTDDIQQMADRCRFIADKADEFTKGRLLDLALKYEARVEGRSLASKKLTAMATMKIRAGDAS
jgi:hypothetical protein